MASPIDTSSRIEARLRPMKRMSIMASSVGGRGEPPPERRPAGLDFELRGVEALRRAEQVGVGLAVGDVVQRLDRSRIGIDDLALAVGKPLRDARRQAGMQ